MADFLGTFRIWFDRQPLPAKRAIVRERLLAYADDPIADDLLRACPREVRDAAHRFREAIHHADWNVVS